MGAVGCQMDPQILVTQELHRSGSESLCVTDGNEQAIVPVPKEVLNASGPRGNNGGTACHRLGRWEAPALIATG